MKTLLAAPVGALLIALAAPYQHARRPAAAPVATHTAIDTFVLEAGSYDIPALVDRVAAYLDYNILYNAAELSGIDKIRITRRTEVDKKGCWELFGSLLYHKDLAIVALDPTAGFHEVIARNGPRQQEIISGSLFVPLSEVESYANQKATPILTSVPLLNINAQFATNALRPFYASARGNSGLTLGNVGNNSDMLLQGFGPQVAAACRLLALVDIANKGSSPPRVVRLEHAAAEDLVARIDDAVGSRKAQLAMEGAGMPMGMPMGTPLRAVAHPALNAVILSGTDEQVRAAEALIAKLDAPSVAPSRTSQDMGVRMKQLEERVQKLEQSLRGAK
ncbi:MAG: secretin N-terminal domain-containing protein [Planctomycetota bacterium]